MLSKKFWRYIVGEYDFAVMNDCRLSRVIDYLKRICVDETDLTIGIHLDVLVVQVPNYISGEMACAHDKCKIPSDFVQMVPAKVGL